MGMTRSLGVALCAAVLGAGAASALDSKAYAKDVENSVVCIRSKSVYQYQTRSQLTGTPMFPLSETAWHGSGLVVDTQTVDGKEEKIILTNNHVGHAEKIDTLDGKLLSQKLFLVKNRADHQPDDDINVELIARFPDHDLALLRTIGAPDIPVAKIVCGVPGGSESDWSVEGITTGFPLGETRITAPVRVTAKDMIDVQVYHFPRPAWMGWMPLDGGQSGSPFSYQVRDKKKITHYLAGVMYAGDDSTDNVRLITPMDAEACAFLEKRETVPSKRPKLTSPILDGDLERIIGPNPASPSGYTFGASGNTYKLQVIPGEDGEYVLRQQRTAGGRPLEGEYVDMLFKVLDGKASISGIVNIRGDQNKAAIPGEGRPQINAFVTGVLNYMSHMHELGRYAEIEHRSQEEQHMLEYFARIVNEDRAGLKNEFWNIYGKLSAEGFVSEEFW